MFYVLPRFKPPLSYFLLFTLSFILFFLSWGIFPSLSDRDITCGRKEDTSTISAPELLLQRVPKGEGGTRAFPPFVRV